MWVLQEKSYQLGNFIMATPAIRALAKKHDARIGVYFETDGLSSLFKECPFMRILRDRPSGNPILTSRPPQARKMKETVSECFMRMLDLPVKSLEAYVDSDVTYKLDRQSDKKHVAIFHGCLGTYWLDHKTLPVQTLNDMVSKVVAAGMTPVVLGTANDHNRFWSKSDIASCSECINYIGKLKLRDSVSVMQQCDAFIGNDSGLYHVGAALKKSGLILWGRTDPIRNASPFKGITHCINYSKSTKKYRNAILSFLLSI